MPNATGRTAKKAAPAAKPADGPKAERHVRSPLERAQAVYDKAKAASDRITTKLHDAEAEIDALKAQAEEAKVTLDWAANHPLLVKVRRDAGEEQIPVAAAAVPSAPTETPIDAGPPELREFTGPVVSTVPEGEGDDAGDDDGDDEGEPEMPNFDFDNPPAIPAPPGNPFETGPQTTHV